MNAIVAIDNKWNIGKDNELLIRIPEDMKRFKELTLNKVIVMGRKTFESLPDGPLKGRTNVIITRDESYKAEGCLVYNSLEDAVVWLRMLFEEEDVFIIGGAEIYELFFPYIDKYYITKIYKTFSTANKSINRLDSYFVETCCSELKHFEDVRYQFFEYVDMIGGNLE